MTFVQRGAGLWLVGLLLAGGCASSEFAAVNQEAGYYYGYGAGSSEAAAQDAAVNDLVYNTFTGSGAIKKETRAKTTLSAEMKAAVVALAPKPFLNEKKSDTAFSAVYRIKFTDWAKAEAARLAQLQAELVPQSDQLFADPKATTAAKIAGADKLLKTLDRQGVTRSLHTGGDGTPVLADEIASKAQALTAGAKLSLTPNGGSVAAGQTVVAQLTDAAGKPISGLTVNLQWVADETSAPALSLVTDVEGKVAAAYPTDTAFRNARSVLKASTKLPGAAALNAQAAFRNSVILADLNTPEVKVDGGTFTIGAVKQDRRAGSKEKARSATVPTFYIQTLPVTNAQYRSYLVTNEVPKDQWPDFLDGNLAGDTQPVVGVTLAEAQKYAAWVAQVTGKKWRLPTEAEYEVAARAGQVVIYPWGDQPPTDGVRAAYSGNGKFNATAPVGSFPNGANPAGVLDLVGNVWQWTTSDPDSFITADAGTKLVKGGSWLDGPGEARISNRKAVNPEESASDVGFRLVREDN